MHIGILTARTARYHPNRRLIEAASRLGHKAFLIHPKKCLSEVVLGKLGLATPIHTGELDLLLPRIGSTINEYALTLVRHFELAGLQVVNGFQSILLARNKFLGIQTLAYRGVPVPDSHFVSNFNNFEEVVEKLGGYPVVVKALNGRQGKGILLVERRSTGKYLFSTLPGNVQGVLVQEFISPAERKDIRILVLGNRAVAAMELTAKRGDFRSNIHLGGKATAVRVDKELASVALRSTKALGLEISGTDIIVDADGAPKVIEVNYSPGFRGLEASTGLDIASEMIRYVTRR